MSEENVDRIERTLNLTDKSIEELLAESEAELGSSERINSAAKIMVDVPMQESPDGKLYRYAIFIPKTVMMESMTKEEDGGLEGFWEGLSQKVLEDIKKEQ